MIDMIVEFLDALFLKHAWSTTYLRISGILLVACIATAFYNIDVAKFIAILCVFFRYGED